MASAAIKGEKTTIELAQDCDVHPNQIKQWRDQPLEDATGMIGASAKTETAPTVAVKTLHSKTGELALENDFLSGALGKAGLLPSAPIPQPDLKLMHRIDKLHMEFPLAGSRMLHGLLVQDGFDVGGCTSPC